MTNRYSKISVFVGAFLVFGCLAMLTTFIWYTMEKGKEKAHEHSQTASMPEPADSAVLVTLMEKLKETPEDPEASRELGMFFIKAQDWARAEHFLKQSLVADPYNAPTLSYLGLAQYRMGNYGAAVMSLEMSITHGKTAEALFNLATIHAYKLNNADKAKELFQDLLSMNSAPEQLKDMAQIELSKLLKKQETASE